MKDLFKLLGGVVFIGIVMVITLEAVSLSADFIYDHTNEPLN